MREHCGVLSHFAPGNYRFLAAPGGPFSQGMVADPSFDLVHATFLLPLPLSEGLDKARRHVEAAGRPAAALAGFELRIPEPLDREGFDAFNAPYVEGLTALGLVTEDGMPAVRTNVAPTFPRTTEPSLYAFTYTVPAREATRAAFRLSGATETRREGSAGDRLLSIVEELERRMTELGVSWDDATAVNVYGSAITGAAEVTARLGAAALHGLTWFPSRPPILDFDFEIDARGVGTELVLL